VCTKGPVQDIESVTLSEHQANVSSKLVMRSSIYRPLDRTACAICIMTLLAGHGEWKLYCWTMSEVTKRYGIHGATQVSKATLQLMRQIYQTASRGSVLAGPRRPKQRRWDDSHPGPRDCRGRGSEATSWNPLFSPDDGRSDSFSDPASIVQVQSMDEAGECCSAFGPGACLRRNAIFPGGLFPPGLEHLQAHGMRLRFPGVSPPYQAFSDLDYMRMSYQCFKYVFRT
jgi:hypothetical protein